ncbi:hypothetical protein LCGC14_1606420 [marine sediment metagenome]|uniref:Uncharacterized protein n=1 Tax=marine sediment metagenome TaxID=412755 RepID=A0A0F9I9M6_9ZZZZ
MSIETQEGIYNKNNIEILAITLVEDLNKETANQIAINHLIQAFSSNKECFFDNWFKYIKYYM